MKKVVLPMLFALLSWSFVTYAQQVTIDSFDSFTDSTYTLGSEGAPTAIKYHSDSTNFMEGAASLDANITIGSFHTYGSYLSLHRSAPNGSYFDWSNSDTLKLWLRVVTAPAHPSAIVFRVQLLDQPDSTGNTELWVYENDTTLTTQHDWVQLQIPFKQITSDGTVNPGDSGFVIAPYNWNSAMNDQKLNMDKIVGYDLSVVTTGNDADSIEVEYDNFERTGNRPIPLVIFNGISTPNNLSAFQWNASFAQENGNGPFPNTNSLHWIMGDQSGTGGWNGIGYNISPAFNLSGGWPVDSLSFYMKSDIGVDSMRVQFEDGTAKVGKVFIVTQDTLWHRYAVALKDMVPEDGTSGFDSAAVTVWQIMAEGDGITGKNVWLSDIWTGHPKAPIPPVAPQGITGVANNDNTNTIIWTDVPGQTNETYNVYYSLSPITDITAEGVEVAGTGIAHGEQQFVHKLLAPATDQSVTYYYAVVCKSGDGLLGSVGPMSSAITNTAKGITTVNATAPLNFQADGDLSEWSNIKPFRVYVSDGSGTVVQNTYVPNDTVSSGDIYVAVDQDYLYVAGHINTNNIVFNPDTSSWFNTATDLFFGLYNAHGAPHTALQSGSHPDYHFRFAQDRVIVDNDGVDSLVVPGSNYYWGSRFPDPLAGYNFEAKISWQDIAHKSNTGNTRSDNLFVPQVGMRIPFDIELSSVSIGKTTRDGQLDYSSIANGNSYANVAVWSYTWIGNSWTGIKNKGGNTVTSYKLSQNYPNPFNPSTKIQYSLMKPGLVTLRIYDVLGRLVKTLVNGYQVQGSHIVNFNASQLASGVYFYKLESGSFQSVKKMMLLK